MVVYKLTADNSATWRKQSSETVQQYLAAESFSTVFYTAISLFFSFVTFPATPHVVRDCAWLKQHAIHLSYYIRLLSFRSTSLHCAFQFRIFLYRKATLPATTTYVTLTIVLKRIRK